MLDVFKGLLKITLDLGFSKWATSERQWGDCDEE